MRNNKKVIKRLTSLALSLGYTETNVGKHGKVWVHPTAIDSYTGRPSRVNFGGSSSDVNFHREVIRIFRRAGFEVQYFN